MSMPLPPARRGSASGGARIRARSGIGREPGAAARFSPNQLGQACRTAPHTVLELGSGGGNNASHMKAHFKLTLVDRSPAMLAVSRALNPECEHLEGDMRTLRLGRGFDA